MKQITIKNYFYRLMIPVTLISFAEASYRVEVEPPVLKNKLFLHVCGEGGKAQRMVFSVEAANLSNWLRAHASAQRGFNQAMPLEVPVGHKSMELIRTGLEHIIKNNLEDLPFTVFDLDIAPFADLLIYCWFLDIRELLNQAGPAFIRFLKTGHLEAFVMRADYLTTVFRSADKPGTVDWGVVIKELKEWLARGIFEADELTKIRSNLRTTIKRDVSFAQPTLMRDQLLLCGNENSEGYCELFELQSNSLMPIRRGPSIESACFTMSPALVFLNPDRCDFIDLLKQKTVFTVLAKEHALDGRFVHMAQSSDLATIAVALQNKILVIDSRSKKKTVLENAELQSKEPALIRFVPFSPVLVDVRGGGSVNFWNSVTRELLLTSDDHKAEIKKVHCLPDGTVLTMSSNGVLIKWDCRLEKAGHFENKTPLVKKWDPALNSGSQNDALWSPATYPLCFNEKGTRVVLAGDQGKYLTVHDLDANGAKVVLENDAEIGLDGSFGRDDLLAVLTQNNRIVIFNPLTGAKLTVLENLKNGKCGEPFFFSTDGEYLVSKLSDEKLCLWYFGSKKVEEYIRSKLTLEQALLLLTWLKRCSIPQEEHLKTIAMSVDHQLLGKFL